MILGYTKKFILIFHLQIKLQDGILIGIILSLVNLQNIKKASIMIGIMILGINLIKNKILMMYSITK